jgi:hypothetical protein
MTSSPSMRAMRIPPLALSMLGAAVAGRQG